MQSRFVAKPPTAHAQVRCAVYTRKSTTEGLDSDFNTLDAQREACEAYILSQRSEGWLTISEHFDDGGFTGGNLDRPALKKLMTDISHGKIDCVVVYKVDRLSRSLLDFARLIEVFDRHQVAFVSVTQQFNTATSMGRLVLNVLLSFAQFEREIISERTSDKMCAARRKGKWLGGPPVLGYDLDRERKKLIVNPSEATIVQELFALYLQKQSMREVAKEANVRGWTTKSHTTKKGIERRGLPFDKARLQRILSNVMYVGLINHKGEALPGEQEPLVDREIFKQVQELIKQNRHSGSRPYRHKHTALLKKLLHCGKCGAAMGHTYAKKGPKLYFYYLCVTNHKQGIHACDTPALPAADIETHVVGMIRRIGQNPELITQVCHQTRERLKTEQMELENDKVRLTTESNRQNAQIESSLTIARNLTVPSQAVAAQLRAEEELRIQINSQLSTTNEALQQLGSVLNEVDQLADALTRFDSLWLTLQDEGRAKLLRRLLKSVSYQPQSHEVSLVFQS